jgi:hypothetical protein
MTPPLDLRASERCPSVHYWSGMQCQHDAGHAGCCVADVWELAPWIIAGKRQVYLWWEVGSRCSQRPAKPEDFVATSVVVSP